MSKLYEGSGWTRADEGRRRRRSSRSGFAMAARQRQRDQKVAERDALRRSRKDTHYLPRAGAAGPAELRTHQRLKIQPHFATSDVLAYAYPFLAEAGLGSEGVFIGQDAWSGGAFCFDPWDLYARGLLSNPNAILIGVIGKGKSALAKSLASRSTNFGRRVYVPCDPKGEWSAVAETLGGRAIRLGTGTGNRLNPLDEGPRPASLDDQTWTELVAGRRRRLVGSLAEAALTRALRPMEHTAIDEALTTVNNGNVQPSLIDVVTALDTSINEPENARELTHALRRLVTGDLSGLFDGQSTVTFDPDLPMISLDLSAVHGSDALIAMVMTCASAWMEAALSDVDGGQRWVIYDEAWRLLRRPALLARMQSQFKLSRALGIANLLIMHRLSDLDAVGDAASESRALALGLLADCSTKIIYQQETSEAPRTADILGLSPTERDELPRLERGEGLWRIGERAFIVRHLLSAGEAELFDTNHRMRTNG